LQGDTGPDGLEPEARLVGECGRHRQLVLVEGRAPVRGYRADDPGAPNSTASWVGALYNGVADTIYAGTSEVQRTILGERVLGLPREPSR